ncbi:MAG: sigma-70 family RNA polymerase sigma factor [Gemmataceae bacterium]|nr:sigma-70 family RNA polymerase sigma factor [Gemmataceae bacterium]
MATTSASLLERLKVAPPGASDWGRLNGIYLPLIRHWVGRAGLASEADDLAQEVLVAVFKGLAGFDRRADGSFRAWLRVVTVNKVRSYRRVVRREEQDAEGFLDRLADPASGLSAEWDRDHDRHVFDRVMSIVRPDFSAPTWEAFRRTAIEGQPVAVVATAVGITENAVMRAKCRVLQRLREETTGLLD